MTFFKDLLEYKKEKLMTSQKYKGTTWKQVKI